MIVFIDHFSKYAWIYLSKDKEAKSVLKYLSDCLRDIENKVGK